MGSLTNKIIAIASDHAGYDKKRVLISYFEEKGIPYKDFGCYTSESCDYADFAHPIAEAVNKGDFEYGIAFCGSGQGVSITANKHRNVRSALCWIPQIAVFGRQHNDANICAIPARFVNNSEVIAIVNAFLSTEFEGGRHARRIAKIPLK
jgi:ribose 5-phosphate isomerase B